MLPLLPLLLIAGAAAAAEAAGDGCRVGCPLALAAYYFSGDANLTLTFIASLFGIPDYRTLLPFNPAITDPDYVVTGYRVSVPFRCSCLALPAAAGGGGASPTFLAGSLPYPLARRDTLGDVEEKFAYLTTAAWLRETNADPGDGPGAPPFRATVNVTVNCSCGDEGVSRRYGLFVTYPLLDGETLAAAAERYGFSSPAQMELLRKYNPGMDGVSKGIVFIPVRDPNGSYRPLESGAGNLSPGEVAGIVIACVVVSVVVIWLFAMLYKQHKLRKAVLLPPPEESIQLGNCNASQSEGIKVDRSIEFSYEELFTATQGFSMDHKIGQGGFGSVYYAELRGEKSAIKKMDTQATQEFLSELKVLTHVHHLNLVRLIGHCVQSCLFLVYEFIDNGNLSQHLRGIGYGPLLWATRVQIALDSARGLEYIHEHTVPVYVHRDIKSANILIDKDFRAKVADFGLAKLAEIRSVSQSLPTRVVGTFGYMPPEYARYGEVSPKVDVYAFGIVLYELLSGKEAIVRSTESGSYAKSLVYLCIIVVGILPSYKCTASISDLFEETLSILNPRESIRGLVDPRLGGDYPVDSVLKMACLAKSCTHEEPRMRPTMRSVVVALMALSHKDQERIMVQGFSPREARYG
ncbi:hypothetical protein ACP4OV_023387 [Aristida adscensionis]